MKFPPFYTINENIANMLREIDILKTAFAYITIPTQTIEYLRRMSLLKSSLFSARIEGNPLKIDDLTYSELDNSQNQHKREVANIARSIQYILRERPVSITENLLLKLHTLVLNGLSSTAGSFRSDDSAIFNQSGVAVYLTPAPYHISSLLSLWYEYCNTSNDPSPIRASVAHIWFEKIHPFLDGNGRLGRLISFIILQRHGYDFGGIVPFEEYLDIHRNEYYHALFKDMQDV